MQTLPVQFTQGRFIYTQIHRQTDRAIYLQVHPESGHTRYEVVKIRVAKAHTWPNGHTTPEHEAYPGPGTWGVYGWTYFTLAEAWALYASLGTEASDA